MANSMFEYVRAYEVATDYLLPVDNYVVVRVATDQQQFKKFSDELGLFKPNDKRCLDLMNKSALSVMRSFYPNILIAYGQHSQFSFVLRPFASLFNRRQNKIVSLITSTFASAFVYYWSEYFRFSPNPIELRRPPPYFCGHCILFGNHGTLIDYLRDQYEQCHVRNLENTTMAAMMGDYCSYKQSEAFKDQIQYLKTNKGTERRFFTEDEAKKWMSTASKADRNEKLFADYGINYNDELEQFKKGTTIVFDPPNGQNLVEILPSINEPLKLKKHKKLIEKQFASYDVNEQENRFKVLHTNLKTQSFWDKYGHLLTDTKIKVSQLRPEYVRQFEETFNHRLVIDTYVVVRVDGQCFHMFTQKHNFLKPNDKRALDLMNKAAAHVMNIFKKDIILAYGQSDEFSFILSNTSNLMNRHMNQITSAITSTFTLAFVYFWSEYFGLNSSKLFDLKISNEPLLYPPTFDGRSVVYPNRESIIDYLKWRQVDCHINNLYNTTFYALTGEYCRYSLKESKLISFEQEKKEGQSFYSHQDANKLLSKTVSEDKKNILLQDYNIVYEEELEQFKKGSLLIRKKENNDVIIEHVDFTKDQNFWKQYGYLFGN